jgi:hypothetical protein
LRRRRRLATLVAEPSEDAAALSRVRFAHVASRTDTSQDVNDTYVSVTRSLADARALRTALLRQLAGAGTQQQIDSLKTRIAGAGASRRSTLCSTQRLSGAAPQRLARCCRDF